jgi:hypothetical protein
MVRDTFERNISDEAAETGVTLRPISLAEFTERNFAPSEYAGRKHPLCGALTVR